MLFTDISYSLDFPSKVLMTIDTEPSTPTDHVSFCTWFKISSHNSTTHLNTLISSKQFHIAVNTTFIQLRLLQQTRHVSYQVNAERWNHICVHIPYKKTTVRLFLNGRFFQYLDMGTLNSIGMTTLFGIGANINNTFENNFHGAISQLYLTNQSLSLEDVSNFFISRPIGIDDVIVSWWDVLQKAGEIPETWRKFFFMSM